MVQIISGNVSEWALMANTSLYGRFVFFTELTIIPIILMKSAFMNLPAIMKGGHLRLSLTPKRLSARGRFLFV